jgi:integrase
MQSAQRFTEERLKRWAVPGKRRRFYSDPEVRGFNFRVGREGRASYTLTYRIHGRQRRYLIGHWPEISANEARDRATDLRKAVREGHDPLAEKLRDRQAPMMTDLARRYLSEYAEVKNRPATIRNNKQMLDGIILPRLGRLAVAAVTLDDVERLHGSLRATPCRANRVFALLSVVFRLAIKWKWRTDNPAAGIEHFHERRREEWLRKHQLERVVQELESRGTTSADALLLILFTGCRKGEALAAQWKEFDLDRGVWSKPSAHTKQKKTEHTPLNDKAFPLVIRMRKAAGDVDGAAYLFPSVRLPGQPLENLRRTWREVSQAAGIGHWRIHDLRHSFGSVLVSSGVPLATVGKLLGHTQSKTTERYAHLADEVERAAANLFSSLLEKASA